MKYYLILLILLSFSLGSTNTNSLEEKIQYVDRKAIYLNSGSTFVTPFTGWFFSVNSTKILLSDQTDAINLRKLKVNLENDIFLLEREKTEMQFKLDAYKYVDDLNKIQIAGFKETLNLNEGRFKMSKPGAFIVGIITGIGITGLTYWGMSQIK